MHNKVPAALSSFLPAASNAKAGALLLIFSPRRPSSPEARRLCFFVLSRFEISEFNFNLVLPFLIGDLELQGVNFKDDNCARLFTCLRVNTLMKPGIGGFLWSRVRRERSGCQVQIGVMLYAFSY